MVGWRSQIWAAAATIGVGVRARRWRWWQQWRHVKMVGMARHGGIGVVVDAGIGRSVAVMVVDVGYTGLIGVAERLIVGFGQKQWMMLRVGVVSEALAVMRVLKLMLQAAATVELTGLAAAHSRCRRALFKASRCFVVGLRCGFARGFRHPFACVLFLF